MQGDGHQLLAVGGPHHGGTGGVPERPGRGQREQLDLGHHPGGRGLGQLGDAGRAADPDDQARGQPGQAGSQPSAWPARPRVPGAPGPRAAGAGAPFPSAATGGSPAPAAAAIRSHTRGGGVCSAPPRPPPGPARRSRPAGPLRRGSAGRSRRARRRPPCRPSRPAPAGPGSSGWICDTVGLQPGPQPGQAAADVALHSAEWQPENPGYLLVRQIRIERQDHHQPLSLGQLGQLVGQHDPVHYPVRRRLRRRHCGAARDLQQHPAVPLPVPQCVSDLVAGDGDQPAAERAPPAVEAVPAAPGRPKPAGSRPRRPAWRPGNAARCCKPSARTARRRAQAHPAAPR